MAKTSFLSYARLAFLSGPASERVLYRQIAKAKPKRILEIGLGLGVRSLRILQVASRYHPADAIRYTGIDPFDARGADCARLTLKSAYKLLLGSRVKIKLVPGEALSGMTHTANSLLGTDLIVIDAQIADQDMAQAWRYFPRMMHGETLVLRQKTVSAHKQFRRLTLSDVKHLAAVAACKSSKPNRHAA